MLNAIKGFLSNQLQVMKSLAALIKLEAALAHRSAKRVIIAGCMLTVITLTTWINIIILLGYCIHQLSHHLGVALLGVLIFNSCLFFVFFKICTN